jgi:hypothetical protein
MRVVADALVMVRRDDKGTICERTLDPLTLFGRRQVVVSS